MLDVSVEQIKAIEEGVLPTSIVVIYWSWGEEEYTEDDYLMVPLGSMNTSVSQAIQGSSYEQSNLNIELYNRDYYFSRLLANELPSGKLCIAYNEILGQRFEIFRGKIDASNWKLTPEKLSFQVT